jgi:hypothetical protein
MVTLDVVAHVKRTGQPMSESFTQKLARIVDANRTSVMLRISPYLLRMPTPVKAYDDPFLPFGKLIINATRDVVAGYVFDFPAYLAIGAAGIVALERTIAYVDSALITVIDGQFSGAGYAHMIDEGTFNADAVILADEKHVSAYLTRADRTAFVINDDNFHDLSRPYGIFWRKSNQMTIADANRAFGLKMIGDEAIYADGTAHIADTLHHTLSQLRDTHG